ncbi:hypothetical protein Phum_PHUM203730 [Pediculus humanus corporis]|uniref:Uncharacterized protein n=1 Tax=Pediculus humanus subsp. corporis TaxID=121224 RepID=E0VH86_PEDHC|nr:uncharacterized protein Phum_PHUM203730 [Pediculus humanus corporis]EEB12742.1 hypothetical protein Phum_PHUM203730 [Pediculus humanus corporis]
MSNALVLRAVYGFCTRNLLKINCCCCSFKNGVTLFPLHILIVLKLYTKIFTHNRQSVT